MADSLFKAFTKHSCPEWLCPACCRPSLDIVLQTFHSEITRQTRMERNESWFDSDNVRMVFSCLLKCSRPSCLETVAVSGEGRTERFVTGIDGEDEDMIDLFSARAFFPPLPLFPLPQLCPEPVRVQISEVSSLLTCHPAAAANAIRSLLEKLLDDMHVPREERRKGKKARALTLNERIVMNPELLGINQQGIMALKLIGNAGSHGSEAISQEHLEDACHVLELLINQIYPQPSDASHQIARLQKAFGKKSV
ncbi:MAG: DUF4145 domain-containing protein [Pantoea sp.]|uniref:DUF4145 domain-containing protein n=1 Tax=Pantoea sp. TaxID=69393 RepID=UPI0039E32C9A